MARLGDYIEQIRGVSYKPEDICASTDSDAVAILRANNIQDDGLNFDDLVYVKKSKVSEKQYIQKGDIVVCASSGSKNLVGKAAIANEDMEISFGAFCKVVRPKKLMPSYVGHYFKSPKYRNKISELAGGANINNIRNEHIDELDIVIPIIDEQERISIELNKVGGLISLRKQQLSKLDELVKSQFIELFDSRYSTIKIRDVLKTTSGGTPSKTHTEYYEGGTIPWLSSGEVNTGVIYSVKNCITQEGIDNSSAKMVPENTVVIAMYGATAGQVGLLKIATTTNQAVCSVLPNDRYVPEYLYYAIKSKKNWMISQCAGGAQPNISQSIIRQMEIIDAPYELQEQFAAFVEQVDKSKFEIQKSLAKLETLKKALMQKYFG